MEPNILRQDVSMKFRNIKKVSENNASEKTKSTSLETPSTSKELRDMSPITSHVTFASTPCSSRRSGKMIQFFKLFPHRHISCA